MKSSIKKTMYWLMAILPLVVTLLCFPAFPEVIPGHYNLAGEVDRWGSRAELFILPVITLLLAVFWWFFFEKMAGYSERHGMPSNRKVLEISKFVCSILFDVLAYVMLISTYQQVSGQAKPLDVLRILAAFLCIGDLVIANVLPKCRRNVWLGIRLPWTLESEEVWHLTHRFGGKAMVIAGLISLLFCFILPSGFACIAAYLLCTLVAVLIITLYSYQLSRRSSKETPNDQK